MSDSAQRTEKPTPRRVDRARREGDFPSSREFVSAVQFLAFVTLAAVFGQSALMGMIRLTRRLLAGAFSGDLDVAGLTGLARRVIAPELAAWLAGGAVLVAVAVCAQLATTRLGISARKLTPDLTRLNFIKRLSALPVQNLFSLGQALLLLALVGAVVYYEIAENLDSFLELPWLAPQAAVMRVGRSLGTLLWRAAGLFLLIGILDLAWQRRRYNKQLRMSKHEVREEVQEQEGNPHVKTRIRRMQRDVARRGMMREIPRATALIVNPTHYAVAIRYELGSASAPRVLAKGKNYLALRIRQRASESHVPIVENPPLARALYASVDVGQEIPSHLYHALAEILAYIYCMMNERRPG